MDSITAKQCFQIRRRRKRRCGGHLNLIRRAGTLAVGIQHLDGIKERRIWNRREVGKSVGVSSREILVMTLGWRQFRDGPAAPFKGHQRSTDLGRAGVADIVTVGGLGWRCPGKSDGIPLPYHPEIAHRACEFKRRGERLSWAATGGKEGKPKQNRRQVGLRDSHSEAKRVTLASNRLEKAGPSPAENHSRRA